MLVMDMSRMLRNHANQMSVLIITIFIMGMDHIIDQITFQQAFCIIAVLAVGMNTQFFC